MDRGTVHTWQPCSPEEPAKKKEGIFGFMGGIKKRFNCFLNFCRHLCRANVAGGLVSADVLLSGLQGESVHLLPSCIPETLQHHFLFKKTL